MEIRLIHEDKTVLAVESAKAYISNEPKLKEIDENALRVVALSNGIHIFECDESTIKNIVKLDITDDVFSSVFSYMRMKKSDRVELVENGKKYQLTLEEM